MKNLVSISFGYQKRKRVFRGYDEYVRLPALLEAQRILERDYRDKDYHPEFQDHGAQKSYLVNGGILEISPKTYHRGDSRGWGYDQTSEIKLTTEFKNIARLRALLKRLKLPSRVKLRKH